MDSVKSTTALQISKDDLVKICDNYSMNLKKYEKCVSLNCLIKIISVKRFLIPPTLLVPWQLNPLTTIVPNHIETSQLICIANQLTDFYMMGNTSR